MSALIIGVTLGTIYGLMAFGMVASYRISGVVNLGQAGVAHSSQLGRERIWELEPQPLLTARDSLSHISAQWDEALARLKQFVET